MRKELIEIAKFLYEEEKKSGKVFMNKELIENCIIGNPYQEKENVKIIIYGTLGLSSIIKYIVEKHGSGDAYFGKDRICINETYYIPFKELQNQTTQELKDLLETLKQLT